MTERALSGRRIIVLGGTDSLGQSVTDRFRADASMTAADVKLPTALISGAAIPVYSRA